VVDEDEDHTVVEVQGNMTEAQIQAKKAREKIKYQQITKQVKQSVDRIVESEIESICRRVVLNHVEPLKEETNKNNMSYTVIHGNKKAIFKLKNRRDRFGNIKGSIADYFGLPPKLIFLQNSKGEILLKSHKVVDELFPL